MKRYKKIVNELKSITIQNSYKNNWELVPSIFDLKIGDKVKFVRSGMSFKKGLTHSGTIYGLVIDNTTAYKGEFGEDTWLTYKNIDYDTTERVLMKAFDNSKKQYLIRKK